MRALVLVLLAIFYINQSNAQNAKDYLCLDATVVLYYQFHTGDTCTMQFDTTFVFEGDTVVYYTRTFLGEEEGATLFYTYNGKFLIEGSYVINGGFDGTDNFDTKIEIVGPSEVVDTAYTYSFDMSSSEFEQTSRFLETYTDAHGNEHKNVVEVDQASPSGDSHYITVYAPGLGVVSRDGNEMEFIRMEKLGVKK
ncbi:MAG: hypothetical protein GQ574_28730 [Crocinitomix sp.]|nr:hypothetical protein [Crocinitomix sp.]